MQRKKYSRREQLKGWQVKNFWIIFQKIKVLWDSNFAPIAIPQEVSTRYNDFSSHFLQINRKKWGRCDIGIHIIWLQGSIIVCFWFIKRENNPFSRPWNKQKDGLLNDQTPGKIRRYYLDPFQLKSNTDRKNLWFPQVLSSISGKTLWIPEGRYIVNICYCRI